MKEYIERDKLLEVRKQAIFVYENANILNTEGIRHELKPLLDAIVDVPTADVKEVVHGKWIENYHESYIPVEYDENGDLVVHKYLTYKRSVCGRTEPNKEPYCNCGAKMDLE